MSEPHKPPSTAASRLRAALGYVLAAACLVWVFHDVHIARLWSDMRSVQWVWVAPAVVFDVLSYVCQGVRWRLLLRPRGELSTLASTEAIYAGLFINEIVPMRFGELARAYLVARRLGAPLLSVVPSMAVERLLDGIWLALGIGVAAMLVPLPSDLLRAGDILGAVVLATLAVFLFIVLRQRPRVGDGAAREPAGKLASLAARFATGLREIGFSRTLYLSFLWSFFVLFFQALSFWLVMWAYGLRLSLWIGAAVFLIVHLGTALPNAPANVGTYQFFCVVGLVIFGVDKTLAAGFSVVVFVLLTVPLWVLGFWALGRSGTTLAGIREDVARVLT